MELNMHMQADPLGILFKGGVNNSLTPMEEAANVVMSGKRIVVEIRH
jgi:hypothetical protein